MTVEYLAFAVGSRKFNRTETRVAAFTGVLTGGSVLTRFVICAVVEVYEFDRDNAITQSAHDVMRCN